MRSKTTSSFDRLAAGKVLAADFRRRILPKPTSSAPCLFTRCLMRSQVTFPRLCSDTLSWQIIIFLDLPIFRWSRIRMIRDYKSFFGFSQKTHSKIHYFYTTTEKPWERKQKTVGPGVSKDERLASTSLGKMIRTIIRTCKRLYIQSKTAQCKIAPSILLENHSN